MDISGSALVALSRSFAGCERLIVPTVCPGTGEQDNSKVFLVHVGKLHLLLSLSHLYTTRASLPL